jgi:nucleoside 2-deoxyribosyltransferase
MSKIYLIGSLKNRNIIPLANKIRELGYDVFDDWISPGEEADEKWQAYEAERGRAYDEAINGFHAQTVFNYDLRHLTEADIVIMVLPCGKSGHLEFGWSIGRGKTGFILFDGEPDRYDIMYKFADALYFNTDDLIGAL